MKYKIHDNRKGIGIEEAIPWVFVIFVFTFAIIFFKINENIKNDKLIDDIERQKEILKAHGVLMSYLMKINEQGKANADLIAESYYGNNYQNLMADMKSYFNNKLSNIPAWHIEVLTQSDKNLFFIENEHYYPAQDKYPVASAIVPINGKQLSYIKININFGRMPII